MSFNPPNSNSKSQYDDHLTSLTWNKDSHHKQAAIYSRLPCAVECILILYFLLFYFQRLLTDIYQFLKIFYNLKESLGIIYITPYNPCLE